MATRKKMGVRCISGFNIETYGEAAGQSFKKGALVYLVNGLVTVCASDATTIAGVACEDATGTTNAACNIYVLDGINQFLFTTYYDGVGTGNDTFAVAQIGATFAVVKVGDDFYLDISDETNKAFRVSKVWDLDTAGTDVYCRVVADAIHNVRQLYPTEDD